MRKRDATTSPDRKTEVAVVTLSPLKGDRSGEGARAHPSPGHVEHGDCNKRDHARHQHGQGLLRSEVHGPDGDGQLGDYDRWTEELITKKPTQELIDEYMDYGMPKPRNIRPRNLRLGVYRGGMRPLDLYWRFRNGIEGTPMPGNDKLKPEEIWHVVNYVQSLPFEQLSNPYEAEPENRRERN